MGINERKEIEELLSLNGFTFKRSNGPHYVYSDGLSSFALSRSPSDWRGHMNNVSDLKKLVRKAGRDFVPITYDKKQKASQEEKEMNKGFNSPRVIEPVKVAPVSPVPVPTPQQLSTPAPAKEPVVKVLDEVAFAYAVARQKEGIKQVRILEDLLKMGYTNSVGSLIDQTVLSKFLRDRGVRFGPERDFSTQKSSPKAPKLDPFLTNLTDILSSNLADEMKRTMVLMFVKKEIEREENDFSDKR